MRLICSVSVLFMARADRYGRIMTVTNPTLHQVLVAYQRSLIAKIQLNEFAGWGPGTTEFFRANIVEHLELEARYIAAVIEARNREDDDAREGKKAG